jgi:hypothetical protein
MKKALTPIGQDNSSVVSGAYLGQKKPKLQPEIFAPDIVSKMEEYEFGVPVKSFSSDDIQKTVNELKEEGIFFRKIW